MYVQLFLLAFIPSITVLIFFFFSDKYEKEPLHMLFFCFFCGSALSLPITVLQSIFPGLYAMRFSFDVIHVLFRSFVIAALIEESLKYLVVNRVVVRSKNFNEPFDGMIYYVAVAAGFAVYEDFTYIFMGSADHFFKGQVSGDLSAFHAASFYMAGIRSLPGHALFGAISGYYIALGEFRFRQRRGLFHFLALFFGILCHGIFNSMAYFLGDHALPGLILYLFFLFLIILFMANRLLQISPFRKPRFKLTKEELMALWESEQYSKGNLMMFFVLSIFMVGGILLLFFTNQLVLKLLS